MLAYLWTSLYHNGIVGGMKTHFPILIEPIETSYGKIGPYIRKTPLKFSRTISEIAKSEVFLKMENEQKTGSFKIRGALNKILHLNPTERKRVLVSCSAGNHAQGVACATQCVGAKALLVLPESTPIVKEQAVRQYGAQVVLKGKIYDESYAHALKLAEEKQGIFIHAYKDPLVIAGQGSIGLELLEQAPDLDSVIVPIGGGGLISGIALAIKQKKPSCRIYGVVSSLAPAIQHLFHNKEYTEGKHFAGRKGLADGIIVKAPDKELFESYIRPYVEDIVSVTDEEVAESMVFLLERAKTLAEGAGAVSLAGLLQQKKRWNYGKKCALIISGGNMDLNILSRVIKKGLKKAGRLGQLFVTIPDEPGALQEITQLLSKKKANILSIQHDRKRFDLPIGQAEVCIHIETKGQDHLKDIQQALKG